jgi:LacI family transcriptional regulator
LTTIRDVARSANVSVSTVSRVVNGDPAVHPVLRGQVEDTVRRLDYRPNAAARNLRRARTGTVGVVVSELLNPAFVAIVEGIERVASARGVGLFLCDSRTSNAGQAAHLARLHAQRVEGVVLQPFGGYSEQIAPLLRAGIPVVITGNRAPEGELPQVVVREHDASLAAFGLLLRLGHRRIAFSVRARGPLHGWSSAGILGARLEAYRQAHVLAGVRPDIAQIIPAPGGALTYGLTRALLARADRPTALVCGIHTDAASMLLAVKDAGLRIPRDLSFITYGDSSWTEAYRPGITAIRRDFAAYGDRAARLLFDVAGGVDGDRVLFQDCELIERESCAPPPARCLAGAADGAPAAERA